MVKCISDAAMEKFKELVVLKDYVMQDFRVLFAELRILELAIGDCFTVDGALVFLV